MPKLASQIRVAFSNIVLKTGSSLPGDLEMPFSPSDVAFCCSRASFNARVSLSTSVSLPAARMSPGRVPFGALRCADVLRRCALPALRLALTRGLIARPEAKDRRSYPFKPALKEAELPQCPL